MFKIQEQGKPATAIWLNQSETLLSNDNKGDVHLIKYPNNPQITRIKIECLKDKIYLSDITFNAYISVNNKELAKGSRIQLHHQDQLHIQGQDFEIINPKFMLQSLPSQFTQQEQTWQLKGCGDWLDGQIFKVKGKVVLGRDNSCDLTIPGSHLSRRHAELVPMGQYLYFRDLDSANGCYVNGKAQKEAKLFHGDTVTFDTLQFKVIAPGKVKQNDNTEKTAARPAITEKDIAETNNKEKAWVNKPTSVGNQKTTSDHLLAKHLRRQRLIYWSFGIACTLSVVASAIYLYLHQQ